LLRIGFNSRLTKLSALSRFSRLLKNSGASPCLLPTTGMSARARQAGFQFAFRQSFGGEILVGAEDFFT
jgi:hypothetical protein